MPGSASAPKPALVPGVNATTVSMKGSCAATDLAMLRVGGQLAGLGALEAEHPDEERRALRSSSKDAAPGTRSGRAARESQTLEGRAVGPYWRGPLTFPCGEGIVTRRPPGIDHCVFLRSQGAGWQTSLKLSVSLRPSAASAFTFSLALPSFFVPEPVMATGTR